MSIDLGALRASLAGRYSIERELGAGGMAVVYAADDLRHDRKVAIKVLRPELATLIGHDRFLAEIRTVARMAHPHILPLHDSGEAADLLYFVMPYVEGESLRARLKRSGRLPIDEAIRIGREVADALEYAHSRGIVHRDIKPGNILLSGRHALVADFGIARAIDESGREGITRTGVSVGSPVYMSPEQAAGDAAVDGRSDLYSLACVMYEMISGEPPFAGSNVRATLARHMTEDPPKLAESCPEVPATVEETIREALSKDPQRRPADAAEFGRALELGSAAAGADRRRKTWAIPTFAVLALIAAVSWAEFRGNAASDPLVARASISVLPFQDLSPDSDQLYLSLGIAEELQTMLTRIPQLTVLGNQSAQDFADRGDLLEVARELGADYLLDGSVRRDQERLRINVHLFDAEDNSQLWSERYDRNLVDVFEIQEEIAYTIAAELRIPLGLSPSQNLFAQGGTFVPTTNDAEAYTLYLRGREKLKQRSTSILDAIDLFEQAIQRDSAWASPWAALAEAGELRVWYRETFNRDDNISDSVETIIHLAAAEAAAMRALRLDPSSASAYVALGSIHRDRTEWAKAEDAYQRALDLNLDNAEAHDQYAQFLMHRGRIAEAVRAADRAALLDPTTQRLRTLAYALDLDARPLDSWEVLQLLFSRAPTLPINWIWGAGSVPWKLGQLDEVMRIHAKYFPNDTDEEVEITRQVVYGFEEGHADTISDFWRDFIPEDVWMANGATEDAIASLVDRSRWETWHVIRYDPSVWLPEFDHVRSDPRVRALMEYLQIGDAKLQRTPPEERVRPMVLDRFEASEW